MNYSRGGTPTPQSKPGVDKRIDDKMAGLLEEERTLDEAIKHYTAKASMGGFYTEWYNNAAEHFLEKKAKVIAEMKNCTGYRDESRGKAEATPEVISGTNAPPAKEEVLSSKKHKTA